jgi:hypothetical protein
MPSLCKSRQKIIKILAMVAQLGTVAWSNWRMRVIVKSERGATKAWSGCLAPQALLPDNESLAVPCPEVNILPPAISSGLGRCKPIIAEAVGGKTTYISWQD